MIMSQTMDKETYGRMRKEDVQTITNGNSSRAQILMNDYSEDNFEMEKYHFNKKKECVVVKSEYLENKETSLINLGNGKLNEIHNNLVEERTEACSENVKLNEIHNKLGEDRMAACTENVVCDLLENEANDNNSFNKLLKYGEKQNVNTESACQISKCLDFGRNEGNDRKENVLSNSCEITNHLNSKIIEDNSRKLNTENNSCSSNCLDFRIENNEFNPNSGDGAYEKTNCLYSKRIDDSNRSLNTESNSCKTLNCFDLPGVSDDERNENSKSSTGSSEGPPIDKLVSLLKNINLSMKHEDMTCLNISGLKIKKLEFDFSKFVNVNTIDLSDNELNDLPESFCSFKKCVHLNLSKNKFDKVPYCLYQDLYFIRNLDLSYNCIKEFNLSPVCIPYISNLNISHNQLSLPPWWLLHDVVSCLTSLNLSYNPCFLAKLPQAFLETQRGHLCICSNITELDISNTGLSNWNQNFLKKFICLKKLHMSSMECSEIKNNENIVNSLDELPDNLLNQMPLEELEMENCQMSSLPQNIDRLSHLKSISMSHNNFSWLPDKFVHLECLKFLTASHCHLVYLPREMGLLTSLTELWLSFNDISSLPDLSGCKELKLIDLYSNSFSQLPASLTSLHLEALDISANYFNPALHKHSWNGSSYDCLKTRLRQRLPSCTYRTDSIRIEKNYCPRNAGSASSSFKSSWSSYKSSSSRKSWLSTSDSVPMKQPDEVWDMDPDDAWDPELYEDMKRWTSEDSLSRCRMLASYSHRDNYFCPYQENSSFKQNFYFIFSGEEENGQFDDA